MIDGDMNVNEFNSASDILRPGLCRLIAGAMR